MHVLSDSLIVNAEEEPELDSNDDMKVTQSKKNAREKKKNELQELTARSK